MYYTQKPHMKQRVKESNIWGPLIPYFSSCHLLSISSFLLFSLSFLSITLYLHLSRFFSLSPPHSHVSLSCLFSLLLRLSSSSSLPSLSLHCLCVCVCVCVCMCVCVCVSFSLCVC